jgi:hypothetical protein
MLAPGRPARRTAITFRSVNRPGRPGYDPSLQRHHLLPRQLLSQRCFRALFDCLARERAIFDDFRVNGLLLPADEQATVRTGMPLHRGPHRRYNEVVIARVGQIERDWARRRGREPEVALAEALMRLELLQSALRRHILAQRSRILLNRKDPLGTGFDFSELDAMAEALWTAR